MIENKGQFQHRPHWRKPKAHWDYDWLYREYVTNQRSANDIANETGCKENNIYYWLNKHSIKTPCQNR